MCIYKILIIVFRIIILGLIIEGIQLEYKREFPKKGLAKRDRTNPIDHFKYGLDEVFPRKLIDHVDAEKGVPANC